MVIEFVSSKADHFYGIVVEESESGMLRVFWDVSRQLLNRLQRENNLRPADIAYHRARLSWVDKKADTQKGTAKHLHPISTQVAWETPAISQLQKHMAAGKCPLEWLAANPDVVKQATASSYT